MPCPQITKALALRWIISSSRVPIHPVSLTALSKRVPSDPWGANLSCSGCGNPYETGNTLNYSNGYPYIYANFSEGGSSTPEPASIAMMFGGVAILALLERKRRTR